MLRQHNSPTEQRRGVILLVVLALLTLFAVVGITFAFYAQKSHAASVNFREGWQLASQASGPPDIDPNVLLRYALAQLIYDVDDTNGVDSAIRGHSLARNLYGYNDQTLNTQPFNGTGRLHYASTSVAGQDDYSLINYTYFQADGFLRDPEHSGQRAGPTTPRTQQGQPFVGSANPPYSYPDVNFMALAAARASGTSLINSFHRPWLFNPNNALNDPSNPNWTNTAGKYLIQRPRPVDQLLPGETGVQFVGGQWVAAPTGRPIFPYPADTTGDVKNKLSAPGGNDSTWMDMNYPVVTAPDGTMFKPLFAWRVEDLDGKVNVNTAGNLRGNTGTTLAHASHEGWGKWEMSLAQLFNSNQAPTEWQNIFLGNGTITGRYGPDGQPGKKGTTANSGRTARFDGQVDFDASNEQANGAVTARLTLPVAANPLAAPFPVFPVGYGNGSPAERLNHPLQYDYFRPSGPPGATPAWDDTVLPVSDVGYLLYSGTTGSDVMNSTVAQLCPQNFQNARLPGLITTLSMDLDRMGLSPWLLTRQTTPYGYPNGSNPLLQAPSTTPVAFPASAAFGTPPTSNSDFDANWRAALATLEKIDLRQNPPSYPHQSGAVGYFARFDQTANASWLSTAVGQQFLAAQQYRQNLADQIYRRLLIVTGAPQPANLASPAGDPALPVLRWLGQLAVNIVDFIDEDEISTPFNFYATAYNFFALLNGLPPAQQQLPPAAAATQNGQNNTVNTDASVSPALTSEAVYLYWVFGTELPPVVLNEVNTEYTIPPATMMTPNPQFNVNVWAELYCPYPTPLNPNNQPVQPDNLPNAAIPLYIAPQVTGQQPISPYKVVLANRNTTPNLGPLYIPTAPMGGTADPTGNTLGTPDQVRNEVLFNSATTTTVGGGTAPTAVFPDARVATQTVGTYFLVGSPSQDVGSTIKTPRIPPNTPWYKSASMTYQVTYMASTGTWKLGSATGPTITDGGANATNITVLLRRLANPHLPADPNPVITSGGSSVPNPLYNPYVTVDYLSNIPLNNGANAAKGSPETSYGKLQPYASDNTATVGKAASQVQPNLNAASLGNTTVQHTFGTQNNPSTNPRTWLVHLDRQPNNPMELLHVSGFRPWQLTQQFIVPVGATPTPFQHLAQWFDQDMNARSHLLYRLFAFLEATDRAAGVSQYGRVPGRVNINTIWDPEILLALLDPVAAPLASSSNYFRTSDVNPNLWNNLVASRTPKLTANPPAITQNDRPFLDAAAAFLPNGDPQSLNGQGRGLQDTIFRFRAANTLLFKPTSAVPNHPYLQYEMLTKLYNNVTNRSNTFAVWLTVGFFQVTDPTSTPVKLGAEIGASTGTNIRHRFFSVVDRTQIVLAPALTTGTAAVTDPYPGPASPQTVGVSSLSGTISYAGVQNSSVTWQIVPGSLLVIDRGTPNEEVVQVLPPPAMAPANSITAVFQRGHASGFTITMHGNPGPQPQFDPTNPAYTPVVPFYAIFQ